MRIGIDARVLEKKMTGIGRYLSDILKGIHSDKENKYHLFSVNEINYNSDSFIRIKTGNAIVPDKAYSPFWLNIILPALIKKNNIDIFFSPNHLLPKKKLNCKTVITIHDIHHLINKNYLPFFYRHYLNFQLPISIENSNLIVTVSGNSKKDLINFYNVNPSKIRVIHNVADLKFKPYSLSNTEYQKIKSKFNLPEKYVLYVGMIEKRKNILGILKIADILLTQMPELKFLLIGKPGYGFDSIKKELFSRKNVVYLNYIEEEYLVSIYNLAFIFLFPSYYEGFGLPPLEAMKCGIPVLCSNIQVLQEVVGESGFLHDPEDHNGFASDIIKLASDTKLYNEMKNRSIMQAQKFSYNDSIHKLLSVFNELK